MAASNANPGFGCVIGLGDGGSPEAFTDIAEIVGIPGVGVTARTSEVTHMTSPDGFAEHIASGVKEQKSFTVPVNFVADDAGLLSLLKDKIKDGDIDNYRIAFTDDSNSLLTFAALVVDTDISHERDSHAQGSITFLPTGAPTWSTAA